MNQTLYSLSNEYAALLEKDEYTAEDLAKLDMVNQDVREKAVQVAAYILNKKAEYVAVEMAIDKMEERAKRLFAKIESLTTYLKNELERCHIDAITDHPEFEIKFRNNAGRVEIFDETKLPRDFFVEIKAYRSDKKAIKEAIEKGVDVPGARFIKDKSLQIK